MFGQHASRWLCALVVVAQGACSSILGLHPPHQTPDGGGGDGGGEFGDFALAVTTMTPRVPISAFDFLDISITPENGFDADVAVTVTTPPTGVTPTALSIPAGTTTGELEVAGDGTLVAGTTVMLEVTATSGTLSHSVMVTANVTIAPGTLDPTFGSGGIGTSGSTQRGRTLLDLSIGSDGSITAVGFAEEELSGQTGMLRRFTASGANDPAFGTSGTILCQPGTSSSPAQITGLARHEPNLLTAGFGRLSGGNSELPWVARLNADGSFDGSYSQGGGSGVLLPVGDDGAHAEAVANTPDGVLTLIRASNGSGELYRTLGNGHDDQNFLDPLPVPVQLFDSHASLAVDRTQSTLPIYVVGDTTDHAAIAVVRLTELGTLDPGFGSGGVASIAKTGNETAIAIVPQKTSVLIAGTLNGDFFIRRLTESGSVDTTFGSGGLVSLPITNGTDTVTDMVVQADGKILVAGNAGTDSSTPGPILARYTADGALDVTYGVGGVAALLLGNNVTINAVDLQPDGNAIVAGGFADSQGADVVARVGF